MSARQPRSLSRLQSPSLVHDLHQTRTFSACHRRQRNGTIPVFIPSNSPPLSDLLTAIRHKIFFPSHLKKPQQNLIYQTKNHTMLRSEPFEVEIGSEKFVLEPIDRTKDVPDSWRSLREAMRLMGEEDRSARERRRAAREAGEEGTADDGKEWDNLVPLLAGLRTAGRKWKVWQWEIIARTAGQHDAAFVLLEAVRQAKRTGLWLYNLRVVREVLWACRARAVHGAWGIVACEKALGYVEELAKLMEDPDQRSEAQRAINRGGVSGELDVTRQPDVIGVAVELAAKRLKGLLEEKADEMVVKEAREVLKRYVERLLPNMEKAVKEDEMAIAQGKPQAMVADYELLRWVPLVHGLLVAQRLGERVDEEHVERLKEMVRKSKETVISNVGGDEGGKRRGLIGCNDLGVV